jgi:hypothetical protein
MLRNPKPFIKLEALVSRISQGFDPEILLQLLEWKRDFIQSFGEWENFIPSDPSFFFCNLQSAVSVSFAMIKKWGFRKSQRTINFLCCL